MYKINNKYTGIIPLFILAIVLALYGCDKESEDNGRKDNATKENSFLSPEWEIWSEAVLSGSL